MSLLSPVTLLHHMRLITMRQLLSTFTYHHRKSATITMSHPSFYLFPHYHVSHNIILSIPPSPRLIHHNLVHSTITMSHPQSLSYCPFQDHHLLSTIIIILRIAPSPRLIHNHRHLAHSTITTSHPQSPSSCPFHHHHVPSTIN